MFWERFYDLCKEKAHTKPNNLKEELEISSGVITKWKKGSIPNGETLIKIANYFNISVDYLLGRTDDPAISEASALKLPVFKNSSYTLSFASPEIKTVLLSKRSLVEDIVYCRPLKLDSHVSKDSILNSDEDFYITMRDDTMAGAGIPDGAEVLIRRDLVPESGDIAAVFVNNEILLRYIYTGGDAVRLECANPHCIPVTLKADEIKILGRAVALQCMI